MGPVHRRDVLTGLASLTVIGTSGCVEGVFEPGDDSSEEDRVPYSETVITPVNVSERDSDSSGWVHVTSDRSAMIFSHDVQLCGGNTEDGGSTVTTLDDGEFELGFSSAEADDHECEIWSRIRGSGRLPVHVERLQVTVNGEVLETIELEGNTPVLRRLPDPIRPPDLDETSAAESQ